MKEQEVRKQSAKMSEEAEEKQEMMSNTCKMGTPLYLLNKIKI